LRWHRCGKECNDLENIPVPQLRRWGDTPIGCPSIEESIDFIRV
jgi:hypothetical protein